MKLCKDCIHFRKPIDSAIPKCYHPQAVTSREPVYGQYKYTPCITMREVTNPCGLEGKPYQTK